MTTTTTPNLDRDTLAAMGDGELAEAFAAVLAQVGGSAKALLLRGRASRGSARP